MEVEGFLLASGYALMIVLLGWASQITSRNKETRELETKFLAKTKLKRPDYKRMIKEKGATEDSFSAADLTPNHVPTSIRELSMFFLSQSGRRSVAEPGGLQLAAKAAGVI